VINRACWRPCSSVIKAPELQWRTLQPSALPNVTCLMSLVLCFTICQSISSKRFARDEVRFNLDPCFSASRNTLRGGGRSHYSATRSGCRAACGKPILSEVRLSFVLAQRVLIQMAADVGRWPRIELVEGRVGGSGSICDFQMDAIID
jgi:hypothetical protein